MLYRTSTLVEATGEEMVCSKCGAAAADENGVCAICDPWATESAGQVADAVPNAGLAAGPLPSWLLTLSKKHQPGQADLLAAYRRTVSVWRLSAIWRLAFGLQFFSATVLYRTPASDGRALIALWIVVVGFAVASSRVAARGLWLGAAVSLIGLRGEPGLRWLSGLSEIRRLSRYNLCTALLMFVWLFLRAVLSEAVPKDPGFWQGLSAGYTVVLFLLLVGSIGVETRAYEKVRSFLAAVPPLS
jgi:hypothetical protein